VKGPTDTLRDEHRLILRALALVDATAGRLDRGDALPPGWWERLVEWLREFADKNHHAKEERWLFPAMAAAGIPPAGPVSVMLAEHAEGRDLMREMTAGDGRQRAEAARQYVRLLRDHIDKENGVLFPLADSVMDASAREAVASGIEVLEAKQGARASIEHAESEVERLEAALR
jgi:hemerythrin-like domain-containing protein